MSSLLLFLFLVQLLGVHMATAGTIAPSANASRNLFAAELFKKLVDAKSHENVVFSPASIQTCLALAFLGAGSQTANELRQGLKFTANADKQEIAQNYGEFIASAFKTAANGDSPQLRMANRIYVNKELELVSQFNELASKYFKTKAEAVDFASAAATVENINTWVEEQTEHKIKNLLQPGALSSDTSTVLVNAIYFKGKWQEPFSASSTRKFHFHNSANDKATVDMMYVGEMFKYAALPELDAKALELQYKDSDLSMLILLPNRIDGLQALESKLAKRDLNEFTALLKMEDVDVFLPKFRIEYELDLKEPLQQLGMKSMFSDDADFSGLLSKAPKQKVSAVRHKAFLDVNEAGSEAAAATFMKIVPMSLNLEQKVFMADHPFVFAIRSPYAVYFAGHVAKF